MISIIIAFPKLEDAKSIKNVLIRNGYEVRGVCSSGSQVMSMVGELDEGIIICGYRLSDMHYNELRDYLPKGFTMLLVASPNRLHDNGNHDIICLNTPLKSSELFSTLEMMVYQYNRRKKKEKEKPRQRSEEEKATILKAKTLLMNRNNMSEEEAYRYIQKTSMDSGTNMVEMAEMILRLAEESQE